MATHFTIITRKIGNWMGYSPWDGKELDTTEVSECARMHTHTHTHTHTLSSSNHAFSESLPHSSHSHPNGVTHPSFLIPHNSEYSTKVIFTLHGNCQSPLKGPPATQGQGPHLSSLHPSAQH